MSLEDQNQAKALELTNEIIAELEDRYHIQFNGRLTHTGRDMVAQDIVYPFLRKVLTETMMDAKARHDAGQCGGDWCE